MFDGINPVVAAGCLLFLAAVLLGQVKGALAVVARAVFGGAAIYAVNFLLSVAGIPAIVGVNALTLFCAGVLGAPGVVMLYFMGMIV